MQLGLETLVLRGLTGTECRPRESRGRRQPILVCCLSWPMVCCAFWMRVLSNTRLLIAWEWWLVVGYHRQKRLCMPSHTIRRIHLKLAVYQQRHFWLNCLCRWEFVTRHPSNTIFPALEWSCNIRALMLGKEIPWAKFFLWNIAVFGGGGVDLY